LFDSATVILEKTREEARKELVQLQRLKDNEKSSPALSKKDIASSVTEEMLQRELKENVGAKRATIVQKVLLISEMIDPSLKIEAPAAPANNTNADEDNGIEENDEEPTPSATVNRNVKSDLLDDDE